MKNPRKKKPLPEWGSGFFLFIFFVGIARLALAFRQL
jgi:hypothetical protein